MQERWTGRTDLSSMPLPPYASSSAADATQGEADYQTYCAQCHGADGNGGPKAGSIVDKSYLTLASDQSIRTAIVARHADESMPDRRASFARHPLSPKQISDIVAWIASHRAPMSAL